MLHQQVNQTIQVRWTQWRTQLLLESGPMRQEQQHHRMQAPLVRVWIEAVVPSGPLVLVWAEMTSLEDP